MADDKKMLETISETADMGRDSLNQVMDMTKDESLRQALKEQRNNYTRYYNQANTRLHDMGINEKKANPLAKVNSHVMAGIQTSFANDPTSKIAEMVIQGNTMGVTKLTEVLHNYNGENQETRELATSLLAMQQSNIESMKHYL